MTLRQTIAAAFLVVAPGLASAQQVVPQQNEPVVVTSGEAIVNAVPDRAWIAISAETLRAPSPREAQRRNSQLMTPVLDKLKAAGVPADAIRTVSYDLQQEFDFVDNRRVSRGYTGRNTVEVRVDNVDRVGELLEIAVGSGATSVGNLRFDLKDRGTLEREALRLAAADARARAEAAAAGVGRTVDRILRIDEQGVSAPPPAPMLMRAEAAQAKDFAPAISVGQVEIRAHVTLTASLK